MVPGLGTFVVEQLDARYDTKEEIFLPPICIVHYSEQMLNDENANIIAALQKIYDIDLQSAHSKLDMWVTDFFQTLEDAGSVDLGCIGTFISNGNGQLHFTPSDSGITSPRFYALDTFHIKKIKEEETTGKKKEKVITASGHEIVIRLPQRLIKYIAAASVILLIALGFSEPVHNTSNTFNAQQQQTAMFTLGNFAMDAFQESDNSSKAEHVAGTKQPEEEPEQALEDNYCIVLASAVSDKNAANYVELLKQRGFASARILKGNMNRVVVGHYATEEEARTAATEIHNKGKEYANAWIYKHAE